MFSTEQLDTLRQEITDDLAAERIWRDVGDHRQGRHSQRPSEPEARQVAPILGQDIIRSAYRKAPRMTMLTITFDGKTVYEADVESFGLEANAKGDLFVTASTEPSEPDIDGNSGDELDDRLTPFERSLLTKREADETASEQV